MKLKNSSLYKLLFEKEGHPDQPISSVWIFRVLLLLVILLALCTGYLLTKTESLENQQTRSLTVEETTKGL